MKISSVNIRLLLVSGGLSGAFHILFWFASPKVLGSAVELFFWPALFVGTALNSLLPSTIAVQYDPLPHPVVWWVAVPINFVLWAVLAFAVILALRNRIRKTE